MVGFLEARVNAHDIAAVHVIVEEAGGKVTGLTGAPLDYTKPLKGAVLSNGVVHEELVKAIKEYAKN
jgi:fructose-1,6-bisphosphatase/inositol monophosphatase family enzyme